MFTRYASAISTSTLMTLGLIYIMQSLISLQPGVITDPAPRFPVNWVRIITPEEPPRTIEHEVDVEELTRTVLPPDTRFDAPTDGGISVPLPTQKAPTGQKFTPMNYSDGPLVTMINVQPTYPIRAIQNEIEGHVIVEFDVDPQGRAINIRVVEATHQLFVKAAIQAAERIKFKARVVDGNPVTTSDVRKLFRFELEKE